VDGTAEGIGITAYRRKVDSGSGPRKMETPQVERFEVEPADAGQRIDVFL